MYLRRDFRRLLVLTFHASIPHISYATRNFTNNHSVSQKPSFFSYSANLHNINYFCFSVMKKKCLFSKFSARCYIQLLILQPYKRLFNFVYLSTFADTLKVCYTREWEKHLGFQYVFPQLSLEYLETFSTVQQRSFPREFSYM